MLPNLRKSITIFCLIISITQLFSQQNFWQPQKLEEYNQRQSRNENNLPNSYQLFRLSFSDIKTELLKTSLSKNLNSIKDSRISLLIPMPDGSFEDFYIAEDPILSNETAILLPNVKTYEGQSKINPNLYIRFTISPLGFNGIIVGHENGRIYLSPYNFGENEIHIINYEKDEKQEFNNIKCGQNSSIDNSVDEIKEVLKNSGQRAGDCQLRTYKLAVAATGEYTTAATSQALAQAQITSTINNIITTFKKELSITFTLVLENSITFTDPNTDPYPTLTNGPDAAFLSTNHTTLVSNLSGGSAAFDLGHVFHKGWGAAGLCSGCGSWQGLAGVSVVCDGSSKGRAASGGEVGGSSAPPMGPNFEGVVAHEIGHQFSALHTQSLTSCQFSNNGYEIVAGSTLMGYGTSCSINYNAKDYYMHARTLSQISTFMISSATCASISSTGNSAPTVTVASNNYSIPAGSYFELTSTGNDSNGDAITYNWEQYDIGSMSTWPTSTTSDGPMFRSFPSSTTPKRTFPNIQKLLTNTLTNSGEVVPTVERNLKFRCTVRDNAISGGCSSEVDVDITLNSTAPLNITSFNSSTSWFVGDSKTITWDAGGSTSSGNCSNVNILYTINNGATWTTWISNTANDGTENLTVPNALTNTFRFKIECVRDATLTIFDVNNANITILATCAPPASTVTPNAPITASEGNSALNFCTSGNFGSLGTVTGTTTNSDPTSNIAVLNTSNSSCQAFGNNPNYHTYKFRVSSGGSSTINVSGSSVFATLYSPSFVSTSVCTNFLTSSATWPGSGSSTLNGSLTSTTNSCQDYEIRVSKFSTGQVGAYTLTFPSPAFKSNITSGYGYMFVIVNNSTNNIVAIQATTNLTNPTTFPAGSYNVYGLSYILGTSLNTYIGGSFANLESDISNNSICAAVSTNFVPVTITSGGQFPVELTSFTARYQDKISKLNWVTESEKDSKGFNIERSINGNDFENIGFVASSGNSYIRKNYNFNDTKVNDLKSKIVYYRLNQIDFNNDSELSEIVSVQIPFEEEIKVYPNPTSDKLIIEIGESVPDFFNISIYDISGRLIIDYDAEKRNFSKLDIDIKDITNGIYFIKLKANEHIIFADKIIKK